MSVDHQPLDIYEYVSGEYHTRNVSRISESEQ